MLLRVFNDVETNYIERITTEQKPIQCFDVRKFHRTYAKPFAELFRPTALRDLTLDELRHYLKLFFLQKFSTDPHGGCMTPAQGKKRRTLSWVGFFITDAEADLIVGRVVTGWQKYLNGTD